MKQNNNPIDYNAFTAEDLKKSFVDDIFSKVGSDSVKSIQECIDDINNLIISREELHIKLIKEMESVEKDLVNNN